MVSNQFFEKKGPFTIKQIIQPINCVNVVKENFDLKIYGIESLSSSTNKDITFLNSKKYKEFALKTNAAACITTSNFEEILPPKCIKINVKNILLAVTLISKMFYPKADIDYPDETLSISTDCKNIYPNVFFGKNVMIGKNVKIGNNTHVGSNTIIERNVEIGENCIIGSGVVVKNSLIYNDVNIQDGCKIGIKGFGFIPFKNNNLRTPHVGKVILHQGVEVGANSTIDRGSLNDTVIGKNTFLDNQIHVAHNVKMGENCMIAGQVGFAGSTSLGDNVVIGGQAGVSGHLKIGNNVKIGGGSGVVNDIPDNQHVMGYPAIPLREFAKKRKKYEK
ncbi:MAG: UDP-3-O-[3-hydroxymyristoyl] glucosamine N-acyltransferase [Pelagibacterales bacterium]|nr:UDP-3-O-[3-hydroxymyristoyl] glucosamine N-acyltransferase [Pelagibacterales bacterium]